MATTIYIVRHGESEGNRSSNFGGSTDLLLTEFGKRQAERTAQFLSGVTPDAIYASDLKRTIQTAQPSADMRGMKITVEPRFREFNGGKWEGMPYADILDKYPDSYGVWRTDIARAVAPGGESVAALFERVNEALDEVAMRHEGKSVFVFTHATPVRAIMTRAMGKPQSAMTEVDWVGNASVTVVEYDGGVPTLIKAGLDEHLGDMRTYLSKDV